MATDVLTAPLVRRSPAPQFGQIPVPESMVSSILSECATASAFYDCAAHEYSASTGRHVQAKDVSVYMKQHRIPTPPPPSPTEPDQPVRAPPVESHSPTAEITSSTGPYNDSSGRSTRNASPDTTRTSTENSHDTHGPSPTTTDGDTASDPSDAPPASPPASIAPVSQPSPISPEASLSSFNGIGTNNYPPPHSGVSNTNSVPVATPPSSTSTGSAVAIEAASASSNHTGAIVGGILGGFALLALITATFLFVRRRHAQRPAPSAEFIHIARGRSGSPVFAPSSKNQYATGMAQMPTTDQHFVSFANAGTGRSSIEYEERLPAFTPGNFRDPVLEKVQASAEVRRRY